jgi:hypothetical protein
MLTILIVIGSIALVKYGYKKRLKDYKDQYKKDHEIYTIKLLK